MKSLETWMRSELQKGPRQAFQVIVTQMRTKQATQSAGWQGRLILALRLI